MGGVLAGGVSYVTEQVTEELQGTTPFGGARRAVAALKTLDVVEG